MASVAQQEAARKRLEVAVRILTDGRGGPQLVPAQELRLGDLVAMRGWNRGTQVSEVCALRCVGDDVIVDCVDGSGFTTSRGNLVLTLGGCDVFTLGTPTERGNEG